MASVADFGCQRVLEAPQLEEVLRLEEARQEEVRKQEEVSIQEEVPNQEEVPQQAEEELVVHQTQAVQNRPAERRLGVRKALSIYLLDYLVCKE